MKIRLIGEGLLEVADKICVNPDRYIKEISKNENETIYELDDSLYELFEEVTEEEFSEMFPFAWYIPENAELKL